MLPLYLLAAHLVGDYLLQTRWQAVGKFGSSEEAFWLRVRHVLSYTAAFVPAAIIYGDDGTTATVISITRGAWPFLALLFVAHFVTDAQRFTRTPGEWFAWHFGGAGPPAEKRGIHAAMGAPIELPPNPWPPIGLAIDQTLHIVQIAVLAGIFLT